jgi:Tol biopolymer transport system component
MSRLKVALAAAAVLLSGVAAIPAYGVDAVANGKLAFVADEAGKPQVFTVRPDGTGLTRLTNRPNGVVEYGLAWSPDASSLLIILGGSHDLIYRADTNGAPVRRLSPRCAGNCLGDSSPTYSHSGAKIAFERAFGPETNDTAAAVAILTMNANGSGLKQLTQMKEPTSTEDHNPSWSPDGKRIAFQRYNTTAQPTAVSAIYVMNADGTHVRRLTPRSIDASGPRWSRDGTRIAFNDYAEDVPNKSANVYTIRPDGTSLRKVTHYSGGTKRAFVNDWSPDGRQIVYHLIGDAVNDLYVVNADGTNTHALTHLGPKANPRHSTWGTAH